MNSGYGSNQNSNRNGRLDFLTDPEKGLGKYFNIGSPQDLVTLLITGVDLKGNRIVGGAYQNSEVSDLNETVRNLLLNVTRGCLTTPNLIKELHDNLESVVASGNTTSDDIKTQFRRIIQINAGPDTSDFGLGSRESLNEMLAMPTDEANSTTKSSKDTPTLSSIMVFPSGISPAVKNTSGLSLFFNSIPPLEMARASPYLEVNVQVKRSPLTGEESQLNAPSMLKFIMGAQKLTSESNIGIAQGSQQRFNSDGTYSYDPEGNFSIMGMEAFMMPQTMAPFGENNLYSEMNSETLRVTPVLDPFRPLLSIQGLDVKVVNSTGIGSYKNATLTLLIHDRSRLAEVADFIKPDLYSKTQLMIEYGWIHPDNDPTINPWGVLINTLRCREKYGVTNSSFNMAEDGQITVTLDLHMLGGAEYNMTKVTETPELNSALKKMQEIQKRIAQILEEVSKKYKDGKIPSKSVFAEQIFEAATSVQGTADFNKLLKEYNSVRSRLTKNTSELAKAMVQQLDALYKKDGGAETELRRLLDDARNKKYKIIGGSDKQGSDNNDDGVSKGLISPVNDSDGFSTGPLAPGVAPESDAFIFNDPEEQKVWFVSDSFTGVITQAEANKRIENNEQNNGNPPTVQPLAVDTVYSPSEDVENQRKIKAAIKGGAIAAFEGLQKIFGLKKNTKQNQRRNSRRNTSGGAGVGTTGAGPGVNTPAVGTGAGSGGTGAVGADGEVGSGGRTEMDIGEIEINLSDAHLIDVYDEESVIAVKQPGPPLVKGVGGRNVVSFGKLFMLFVAQPLLSTGEFDDIQVIFYACNSGAGKHRNKNIASFPIEIQKFKKQYDDDAKIKRSPHFSINEFVAMLSGKFFDDQTSLAYGLNSFYKKNKDGAIELKKKVTVDGKTYKGQEGVAEAAEDYLEGLGIEGGIFRPIQVSVILETLPEIVPTGTEGQSSENFEKKTILRIHVYDKTATAYASHVELINASKSDELGRVTFSQADDKGNESEVDKLRAIEIIAAAENAGLIEKVDENTTLLTVPGAKQPIYKHYKIKGGHKAIKEFVMSGVPYIIYGAQNTLIESLGLSSMQMPELSTVNIIRSPSSGYITPMGQGQGGVPLKVVPVQMSVSTLGCPVISFAQQLFIDVGTGTDIDNIYAVTDLNHKLEPGSFKTTMGMTPQHAYAKYESMANKLEKQLSRLTEDGVDPQSI